MASQSFAELMDRLREKDPVAAQEVFCHYARRMAVLAQKKLSPGLRQKVGVSDIVQSVFQSFFVHIGKGEWNFDDPTSLGNMLVRLTICKCARQANAQTTQRRDFRQQVNLEAAAGQASHKPSPVELAMFGELVERLLSELDADDRHIVELRLQGQEFLEIADAVQLSERTVRRKTEKVRARLRQLVDA